MITYDIIYYIYRGCGGRDWMVSTNKTVRHNITEILLKVALNTVNSNIDLYCTSTHFRGVLIFASFEDVRQRKIVPSKNCSKRLLMSVLDSSSFYPTCQLFVFFTWSMWSISIKCVLWTFYFVQNVYYIYNYWYFYVKLKCFPVFRFHCVSNCLPCHHTIQFYL